MHGWRNAGVRDQACRLLELAEANHGLFAQLRAIRNDIETVRCRSHFLKHSRNRQGLIVSPARFIDRVSANECDIRVQIFEVGFRDAADQVGRLAAQQSSQEKQVHSFTELEGGGDGEGCRDDGDSPAGAQGIGEGECGCAGIEEDGFGMAEKGKSGCRNRSLGVPVFHAPLHESEFKGDALRHGRATVRAQNVSGVLQTLQITAYCHVTHIKLSAQLIHGAMPLGAK